MTAASPLLRMPPARSPCPGRNDLDTGCAPAEYGSYREARTGKISQIEVSTLLGESRWGTQLDIRPVSVTPDGDITSGHVAGYLAKYATKATEPVGLAVVRITADTITHYAAAPTHQGRLIRACWKLGAHTHPDFRALRRWAHMLGYRGHFLTKSRRYSVTFKALRAARATWRRRQEPSAARTDPYLPSIRLALLTYAGTGWRTSGDALLALSAAARAREHERIAREETCMT